jgi:hypothetical protein
MSDQGYRPRAVRLRSRARLRRKVLLQLAFVAATTALGFLAMDGSQDRPATHQAKPVQAVAASLPKSDAARVYSNLLNSEFKLGPAPTTLGRSAPLDAGFRVNTPLQTASLAPAVLPQPIVAASAAIVPRDVDTTGSIAPSASPSTGPVSEILKTPAAPRLAPGAPLPIARPSELKLPETREPPAIVLRQPAHRPKVAAAPAQAPDNRSFFEKFFGVPPQPAGPALAYAAPEDDVVDRSRGRRLSPGTAPAFGSAQATAIYDISARMVYMPNGDRLEAHSGLGDKMDDPRFVHVRMHGATPPHTYDLTEREALFHGVRALRLNPVGGSGAIHGRAGLLTHTYLLGPNGDSNGCVSFKDYDKFLQAYLRGEVKRLVVVASRS